MIELSAVTKVFTLTKDQRKIVGSSDLRPKLFTAVDSVTFKCESGKVFALIGPNGSGKTTTLRMISTMMRPTSGSININGHDTAEYDRLARKSIGFMTNQTALYDRLSPYEMVKYFADLNRMEKDIFEKRCRDIFDRLDMHTFANKRIGTLSSGMKQKTSIARTIIHDPDIIVFDEPTTGLSFHDTAQLLEVLQTLVEGGNTVVVIEHHLDVIKNADWIIDLGPKGGAQGGKILAEGTPEIVSKKKSSYTGKFLKNILNAV